MSNKIVVSSSPLWVTSAPREPSIYRAIIDDVIASIKPEFDEYGVSEDVLHDLQDRWEKKVIASHVAEFDSTTSAAPTAVPHPTHPAYPPHPMHAHHHAQGLPSPYPPPTYHAPHVPPPPAGPQVKSEPVDTRYMLSQGMAHAAQYGVSPLPGPQLGGARPPNGLAYPTHPPPPPTARYPPTVQHQQPPQARIPQVDGPSSLPQIPQLDGPSSLPRIPQLDGPSSSSSESGSPEPGSQAYAPRALHPSLPQPSQSTSQADNDEAINSDLDDSDSDNEEVNEMGSSAEQDIVFCTYDKVARVKNKWKCILKDGMIHINGKDYLFAKCTGEFEW
ncbi:transcription factor IIA alpha/beta subunit [Fomitopsis schrenkii]|uniref:Transcription factor IIA alpha/beta subunit n=1 Tax=Fomitopsis schrenkii TaxID=2126942 RepID=S8FU20_FOMSC|nr:transcription factor IIA alpha/beta subunit [Fomitopsis schrenkii]